MTEIFDINDSRIELYHSLKDLAEIHNSKGLFIAEGEKVARKLLQSDIEIVSVFAVPDFYVKYADLIKKRNLDESIFFTAPKSLMNKIIGFKLHTGILALGKIPDYQSIDELDDKIVMLNGIIDSENVGAIVRNCAAFDIGSIIVDKNTSSPYLRRAVRVSMGTIFKTKLYKTDDLLQAVAELRQLGYWIVAAEITENAINIGDYTFPEKSAIIFGTESHGVAKEILMQCDAVIKIPITDRVESINVAASTAIFLYQVSGIA